MVVQVHCDENGVAKKERPQLSLPVIYKLRIRFEHGGEEIAVSVLILAPVLKILKEGEDLIFWAPLKVSVDANIPPVADLLTQVGGVQDKLGLEEGVLSVSGQKTQI